NIHRICSNPICTQPVGKPSIAHQRNAKEKDVKSHGCNLLTVEVNEDLAGVIGHAWKQYDQLIRGKSIGGQKRQYGKRQVKDDQLILLLLAYGQSFYY